MPQAMPLTTRISQGTTRMRDNRMLSARFGDGYSQEAPDGTNAATDRWTVTYDGLTSGDRTTVLAVLDAVGGWDYITWTAPGDGSSKKWKVVEGYRETWNDGAHSSISFEVRQIF